MKRKFTTMFYRFIKDDTFYDGNGNMTSSIRRISVLAFLAAWSQVCVPHVVQKAACRVGLRPFNPDAVKANPFVRDFTDEEKEQYQRHLQRLYSRFNINNLCITDCIFAVRIGIKNRTTDEIINGTYQPSYAAPDQTFMHIAVTKAAICKINETSDRWLSRIEPYRDNRYE